MNKIGIIGGGNIGTSLASGIVSAGIYEAGNITISKRNPASLDYLKKSGFNVVSDNASVVNNSDIIIIAVLPQQFDAVISQISPLLDSAKHLIISVVSGVSIQQIEAKVNNVPVVRAMPNTAIAIQESMTCIATNDRSAPFQNEVKKIFDSVGSSLIINEELMTSATALCACGTAFFLRAIRAASQGGIEIGFHADEALHMAAQTAKGAASLLLKLEKHPEREIDKVTSPEGCTIAGLNEMEHHGFSSAMIRGIVTSATKAQNLYKS